MKIAVVGSDPDVVEMVGLSVRLRWPDGTVLTAETAGEGLVLVERAAPDALIFNPSFSDLSLSKAIQDLRQFSNLPLITLASQGSEFEAITALESGSDDYVRLPCDLTELMARIWALFRRAALRNDHEGQRAVRSGEMYIVPSTYELLLHGRHVMLTPTEFRVLYLLVKNWGGVVSHATLERTLWGEQVNSSGLVKKYIQRLRQKLGDNPVDPVWISSIHGVGYRFMGPKPELEEAPQPAMVFAV